MSDLSDLQAAIAALVTEAVTDLENVIGQLGTAATPAQLQALTVQANDTVAKLKADMAGLTATPIVTPSGTASPPAPAA